MLGSSAPVIRHRPTLRVLESAVVLDEALE
jgi:hypothetical protein